ncbi:hypothetical protein MAPG_10672 [Magnaporthiopsis poae ATCC 64411]|uniref:Uncharacterized protein n=1 Tax=Magnaporthiopsis poae (strain ATCC 64411 / 73-15) TaxID=644358 RepID=A0A0C4ED79_MAGP6|nr:hypothetical protein MAPG_10672 [Magnaporthiopsis poae ATCC 64411]
MTSVSPVTKPQQSGNVTTLQQGARKYTPARYRGSRNTGHADQLCARETSWLNGHPSIASQIRPEVVWASPVRHDSQHLADQIGGGAGLVGGEERLEGESLMRGACRACVVPVREVL